MAPSGPTAIVVGVIALFLGMDAVNRFQDDPAKQVKPEEALMAKSAGGKIHVSYCTS